MTDNEMRPAEVVARFNKDWQEKGPDAVGQWLARDVVFVAPGYQARMVGREACVDSFRQFLSQADVTDFDESDWQVDEIGDTAVVSYRFEVGYSLDGSHHRDTGRDMFVLRHREGRWWMVWRGMTED